MRINIENLVNQAAARIKSDACAYGYVLKEFVNHLKILRDEHQKGNGEEALNEFFGIYVFSDNQCASQKPETDEWICTKCAWRGDYKSTDPVMYRGIDWQNCPSCGAVAIPASGIHNHQPEVKEQ